MIKVYIIKRMLKGLIFFNWLLVNTEVEIFIFEAMTVPLSTYTQTRFDQYKVAVKTVLINYTTDNL